MRGFIFIFSFLFFFSCSEPKQYYLLQGSVFHTSYHIKYESSRLLDEEIKETLNRFDLSLNPFNDQSVIYKINNNIDVEADDWFMTVFNKAMEVSERSEGTFDITAAPFINLWGFGFNKEDSVTPQLIDSLKQLVGYQKVRSEGRRIIKEHPGILLNASAIAKGYACDVVAELLDSCGINNYMVEIGGEIRVKGINPNKACWRVEITKPYDDRTGSVRERQEVLSLCEGGLATSGNYRNFYLKDGKKIAHTIDPRTGYPAEQNMLSATVIAPDCMTADAYATAFMTLGLEKSVELAEKIPELAYYFIYSDPEGVLSVQYSENMSRYFSNDPLSVLGR